MTIHHDLTIQAFAQLLWLGLLIVGFARIIFGPFGDRTKGK